MTRLEKTRTPQRAALALLALLLLLLPGIARAQGAINVTINDVDTSRFPRMVAYVTVVDGNGRTVAELAPTAFALTEDGTPVQDLDVAMMENAGEPIRLTLALDTSGSMRGAALRNTKAAATQLIRDLGPADKVAVLSFDDEVTTHLEFSTDKDAAVAAVESLAVGGDTALHDAILRGVELLDSEPRGRKALVVLTDGEDTASGATMDDAIQAARGANVPVYAIGFGTAIKPAVLENLAVETGGHFYRTPSSDEVDESFEAVARLLRYQYVIEFVSSLPADGAQHTLLVNVEVEGVPPASGEATFVAQPGEVRITMQGLADGDTVGGIVILKPDIEAPGEVVQVEYFLDGELVQSVPSGDLAYEWDASGVELGAHTLTVRATDSAGNLGQADLSLNVIEPVVISFISPSSQRPVAGPVPVSVDVAALSGVAQVRFAVDGAEVAAATEPPWAFTWDTSALEVATHTLAATAYDVAGQSAQVRQDLWVGMRLDLSGLSDGDTVGGLWTLEPGIVAPGDPVQVEYLVDGVSLATRSAEDLSYEWDASGLELGEHTLTMQVIDSQGTEGQLALSLAVTRPLVVAFVAPPEKDLQQLPPDTEVAVEVEALNDLDRVEFAVDGQVVETVGSAPYRFVWDTTAFATGEHLLSATAYDVKGQSDTASLDVWIAFRGSNWGLWAVIAVLVVGIGLAIPLARRRRRTMAVPTAPGGSTLVGPGAAPVLKPGQAAGWLVVEHGPDAGRRTPVPMGETSLGRSRSANDIVIPSSTASRRHAAIRADAEGCVYYDIEPTNPTLINDTPIVGSHDLRDGDRIRIGDIILRFTKEA